MTGTTHGGPRWLNLHLGEHLTSRSLRSDRLLDEVHAVGGDAKRLGVLFGLSVTVVNRCTLSPWPIAGGTLHCPALPCPALPCPALGTVRGVAGG
ncbi:hypothetical protein ACIRP5_31330 [Streptomyces sp. NPDC101221]|uniref:hypothetical protein n=1 Tax=Streptomyces sp. NPDC101221 TaxID=3366132 RepID=UPI003829BA95